jgi:hypothetical protein
MAGRARAGARRRGTSEALWTPALIDTSLWYDASDPSTIVHSAGKVSQIQDKSGNAQHLNQPEGVKQPTTLARVHNARNVLDFDDATDQHLIQTGVAVGDSSAIFIGVFGHDVDVANQDGVFRIQDRVGLGVDEIYLGVGKGVGVADSNIPFAGGAQIGAFMPGAVLNWDVSAALPDSYCRAYLNGTQEGADVAYNFELTDGRTSLMSENNPILTCDGFFGEFVKTEAIVSDAIRELLEGYLAWKWGLVGLLPMAHPFKATAPKVSDAPLWTPAAISTKAWYDAADAATITETAGAVDQWDDKSGNNNHLTNVGSGKPETGTHQINGLNALDFQTNDKMQTAGIITNNPIEDALVISVVQIDGLTRGGLFSLSGSAVVGNRWNAHVPWDTGDLLFDVGGASAPNRLSYATGWVGGETRLMGLYSSVADGKQELWEDGVLKASDADGHSVVPLAGLVIGDSLTNNWHNGPIGEFIVVEGASVPAADRQKLEGYLAWKWGLESQLPVGHPYEFAAPIL